MLRHIEIYRSWELKTPRYSKSVSPAAPPLLLGLHRLCLKLQRAATHHIDLSGLQLNQNSKTWLENPSFIFNKLNIPVPQHSEIQDSWSLQSPHFWLWKSCSSTSSSTLPCREAAPWPQRARLKGAAPSYWKGKKNTTQSGIFSKSNLVIH